MNMNELKYYIYNERGMQQNRIMFQDEVTKYGKIIQIS